MESESYKRLFPQHYHEEFLKKGVRADSRSLQAVRKTTIAFGKCYYFTLIVNDKEIYY